LKNNFDLREYPPSFHSESKFEPPLTWWFFLCQKIVVDKVIKIVYYINNGNKKTGETE